MRIAILVTIAILLVVLSSGCTSTTQGPQTTPVSTTSPQSTTPKPEQTTYMAITTTQTPIKPQISGKVYYLGAESAPVYVMLSTEPFGENTIPAAWTSANPDGSYTIEALNETCWLSSWMDLDGDHEFDMGEPAGFAINRSFYKKEEPDAIVAKTSVGGVDITLEKAS